MKVNIINGSFVEFRMVVKLMHTHGESKIVRIETMKELTAEVRKFKAVKVETQEYACVFKEGI
jgi:hypothetical protein